MMPTSLAALLELLDLEPLEVNLFRGVSPETPHQRVFGGQVAGQALVAAGRTVPDDRHVHSLHAYFLRPGDPTIPIVYEVDQIRDGRSFTTRRVVAVQHGKAIFNLSASFQIDEPGVAHEAEMPEAPDPDSLLAVNERGKAAGIADSPGWNKPRPIDLRYVDDPPWWPAPGNERRSKQQVWI